MNLLKQQFIFLTQLLLKIPVFDLNMLFVFHRTSAIDIQSEVEFLLPIHYFLASGKLIRLSVYTVLVILIFIAEELTLSASD